ncbi:MAG: hypothetical protein R6T99_10995 [Bacteroidales bacterium]
MITERKTYTQMEKYFIHLLKTMHLRIYIIIVLLHASGMACCQYPDMIIKNNGDTVRCKLVGMESKKVYIFQKENSADRNAIIKTKSIDKIIRGEETIQMTQWLSPGIYLQKASRCLLASLILQLSGSALCFNSLAFINDAKTRNACTYTGAAMGFIGLIAEFAGRSLIGKAGRAMQWESKQEDLSFGATPNGIGFVYRFAQ